MENYHIQHLLLEIVHFQTWKWKLLKMKELGKNKKKNLEVIIEMYILEIWALIPWESESICLFAIYIHMCLSRVAVMWTSSEPLALLHGGFWECDLNVLTPHQNSNPEVKHTDIFSEKCESVHGTIPLKLKAKKKLYRVLNCRYLGSAVLLL